VQRVLAREPKQRYDSRLAFARGVLASTQGQAAPAAVEPGEATVCLKFGAVFHLPERARGKPVRCRACQEVFRAPLRDPATASTPQAPVETAPAMAANRQTLPVAVSKAPSPRSLRGAARTRQAASGKGWNLLLVAAAIPLIFAGACGLGGWMIFHNPGPGSTRSAEGNKASGGVTLRKDREEEGKAFAGQGSGKEKTRDQPRQDSAEEPPEPLDCTSEGGVAVGNAGSELAAVAQRGVEVLAVQEEQQ
jgi:hypothetical protein